MFFQIKIIERLRPAVIASYLNLCEQHSFCSILCFSIPCIVFYALYLMNNMLCMIMAGTLFFMFLKEWNLFFLVEMFFIWGNYAAL